MEEKFKGHEDFIGQHGAFCWSELMTTDVPGALEILHEALRMDHGRDAHGRHDVHFGKGRWNGCRGYHGNPAGGPRDAADVGCLCNR